MKVSWNTSSASCVRQPERLRDRVDVARVALDELPPGVGVAGAAACDELGVRDHRHIKQESAGKAKRHGFDGKGARAPGRQRLDRAPRACRPRCQGHLLRARRRARRLGGARCRRRSDRPGGRPAAALEGVVRGDHPRRARAWVRGLRGVAARPGPAQPRRRGQRLRGLGQAGRRTGEGALLRGAQPARLFVRLRPARREPRRAGAHRTRLRLALRSLDRARGRVGPHRLRALERLSLDHRQVPQGPQDGPDGPGRRRTGS